MLTAIGVALCALLGLVPGAQAAQISKFCGDGEGGGQCYEATALATSPADGHLFEVDTRNNRIQEFTPWGEFVKAFGWGVVASGPGNEPRNEVQELTVTATGGSFKLRYGIPGSFTAAETAPLSYEPGVKPSAAEVESALIDAPPNTSDPFKPGDLSVSGPAGGPWTLDFAGQYADADFGSGIYNLEGVASYVVNGQTEGLTGPGASASVTTIQDGGSYEICVPAEGDVCRAGSAGHNPGQFGGHQGSPGAQGIALDSSDNVYVVDRRNHRVQKYDRDGHFLLMFGGEVNKTSGEDVCTAAQVGAGDDCGAGTVGDPGPGEGQFGTWEYPGVGIGISGDFIDVGPDNSVYVGDTGRIQRFGTNGSFQGQIAGAVAGEGVQALKVGPEGAIYVALVNDFVGSKPNVRRLDASGSEVGQLPVQNPKGLATDSAGNVFVIDLGITHRVLGFNASGSQLDLEPDGPGKGLAEGVLGQSTGIAATSPPTCGLTSTNLAISSYTTQGREGSIYLYGGAPDPDVCPQPQVPPTILRQFATAVDTASATLKAGINPRFWPDTRYYVEYGDGKCSEDGCTQTQPVPPGALLTDNVLNSEVLTRAVVLTGLQPATTYHYRFVAQSGGGSVEGEERSFRTARAQTAEPNCPNSILRVGPSSTLPDCRAYELVSPLDKSSGDVARIESGIAQADPSGQRVSYSSLRPFADPEGGPLISQFLSQRQSSGWVTKSISPPRSSPSLYPLGSGESNYTKGFSADLCSSWVLQDNEKLLTSDAPAGVPNLYRRDNCGGGGYELLTSSLPPGFGPVQVSTYYFPIVQGSSADSSRTVFRANASLAVSPGGPRAPFLCSEISGSSGALAFRWLRDGAPIGGATNSSYTPVSAHLGKTLQCQVTTTAGGRTSIVASESLPIEPLGSTAPPNAGFKEANARDLPGAPRITGTPAVGSTLTCEPGPWKNSPTFAYQWFRNGTAIGGATAATYLPAAADEASSIQCRLTGSNAGGAAVSFSRSITIAANLPLASTDPQIAGNPEAGQALTCAPGTWQGSPTFSYQWLRDGAPIAAATAAEYTLTVADEGKAIQCRVTATGAEATVLAASPRVVVSPAPAPAPPVRTGAGAISGEPRTGEALTCETGTWLGGPTFAYQWLRDGAPIGGATSSDYTLTAADQGAAVQCQLTASNAGGAVVALDATATAAVYVSPPAAPRTAITTRGNLQLYLHSGSGLRLVSVMPNGAATTESATAGTAWSFSLGPNSREDAVYRAVSEDGTRVFWTATQYLGPETSGTGVGSLYLRLNANEPQSSISGGKCTDPELACTIPVSASTTARFVSANPQGSRVVYLTGAESSSEGMQLFTGTVETGGSEPTVGSQLVASGVRGVAGVSEDARRIYFVSSNALTDDLNSEGDEAAAGRPNLYFFEEGEPLDFVATLTDKDVVGGEAKPGAGTPPSPVALTPSRRSSRISPDGQHLAFTSIAAPTGYDSVDAVSGEENGEVFLYDAEADGGEGKLLCVSCNPSGGRPEGRLVNGGVSGIADDVWAAAAIPGWSTEYQPTRALADSGRRVFFESYDALVPADSNGRADLYQWEAPGEGSCEEGSSSFSEQNGGCVRLISSGRDGEDVDFVDATPSGSDVFFITLASLVGDDYGHRDIYSARIGGGFPPRAVPPPGCEGEACQGPVVPPPDVSPSSASFQGAGNVREPGAKPCRKAGKKKAKGKRKGRNRAHCGHNKPTGKGKANPHRRQSKGGAR